ncbi:MAG: hypothetical protein WCI77_01100 [Candidatus Omnitrophota bacterium]
MDFNNYKPALYGTPVFERYLYSSRYQPTPQKAVQSQDGGFSLEAILGMDEAKLLDKVVNTAFCITYRLKIYNNTVSVLENQWNELSKEIGQLYSFKLGYNMNIERRRMALEKEKKGTENLLLEQKIKAWEDLSEPTSMFVDLWHKRLEGQQDKKILGEQK